MTLSGLTGLANTLVTLAALGLLVSVIIEARKGRLGLALGIFIATLLGVASYAVVTNFGGMGDKVLQLLN